MTVLSALTAAGATSVWLLEDTAAGLPKTAAESAGAGVLTLPAGITKVDPTMANTGSGFNVPDSSKELVTDRGYVNVTKRSYTFAVRTTDAQGCLFSSRRVGVTDEMTLTGWIGATGAGWGANGRMSFSLEGPSEAIGLQTQAGFAITDGNWHVVTMVLDGAAGAFNAAAQVKIMVDGVNLPLDLVSIGGAPTLPFSNSRVLAINANHLWSGKDLNADWAFFAEHASTAVTLAQHQAINTEALELSTAPVVAPTVNEVKELDSGFLALWTARPEASAGYEYRINGGTPVAVSGNTASQVMVLSGLTNGTTYTYEMRSVNSHGPGPWSSPVTFKPVAIFVYDTFDRTPVAPSTTALGTPTQGTAWTQPSGNIGIDASGFAYATATAENLAVHDGAFDFDIETVNRGVNLAVIWRYRDLSNYWLYSDQRVFRRIAGSYTAIFDLGVPQVTGQTLRFRGLGDSITFWVNGVLKARFIDSVSLPTDTKVGFRLDSGPQKADWFYARPPSSADLNLNGSLPPVLPVGTIQNNRTGYVYKGRDTKTLDAGSVA